MQLRLLILFFTFLTFQRQSLPQQDSTLHAKDSLIMPSTVQAVIDEVNKRSELVDNIHSEGELTVKTRSIDNSGSIEIKAKKKDDVWFKIEGPLGIDIAEGHFGRKKFIFLDARNDKAIEGSTNVTNIGALTKIRCTFDDLMNAFTGTVRIVQTKKDSSVISEEAGNYVIWIKTGTITRRYWVDMKDYYVKKYTYYDKKGAVIMQIEFSNFSNAGGWYAKTIEVRRPKEAEYFRLDLEQVSLNVSNLSFYVSIPSDTRRIIWK